MRTLGYIRFLLGFKGGQQMKGEKKPGKLKKAFSRALTLACIGVFVYSAYALGTILYDYYNNHKVLAELQEVYEEFAEEDIAESGQIRPQFAALHDINPDIVGWVSIDDTKINYPVLQAEDNEYYLNRNYKLEESRAGSVFMDYRNDLAFGDRNLILYGHNMKDGSMFKHLNKFREEEFFKSHPEVFVDTLHESADAEVFAVYYTTTDFDYIQTDFASAEDYGQLLTQIKEKSMYEADVNVDEDDRIVTLSTCDYTLDPDEGRLVVHAKLSPKSP